MLVGEHTGLEVSAGRQRGVQPEETAEQFAASGFVLSLQGGLLALRHC